MCAGIGLVLDGDRGLHGGADGAPAAVHHGLFSAAPRGIRGALSKNAALSPPQVQRLAHCAHMVSLAVVFWVGLKINKLGVVFQFRLRAVCCFTVVLGGFCYCQTVCVCVRACVPACVLACVNACVRACLPACVNACVRA